MTRQEVAQAFSEFEAHLKANDAMPLATISSVVIGGQTVAFHSGLKEVQVELCLHVMADMAGYDLKARV